MSRVISRTGSTFELSTAPWTTPSRVKSRIGRAGLSGTTPEFSRPFQIGVRVDGEKADRADLPASLTDHAVGRDGQRPGGAVDQDRRAAYVEDRIAVQGSQHPGFVDAGAPVAGVGPSRRRLNAKPAVALDREIQRIVGLDEPADPARQKVGAGRDVIRVSVPPAFAISASNETPVAR